MGVSHVELAHGGELFGARCVHDLENDLPAIDVDLFAVGVFDCRIIALDEYALDELCCGLISCVLCRRVPLVRTSQTTLANTARSNHSNVVLPSPSVSRRSAKRPDLQDLYL